MTAWRFQLSASVALAAATIGVLLIACAADESGSIEPYDTAVVAPARDAGLGEAEAGPCTEDCEYFPLTCTDDVLCPNGPFDPANPSVGMDWRTRVNAIVGRSATDVWLAGAVGAIARYDGASWTRSELGTQESQHALWLLGAGELAFGLVQKIYTRGLPVEDGDAGKSPSSDGWSLRAPQLPPGFNGGQFVTAAWAPPGAGALWFAAGSTLWRLLLTPTSELEIRRGAPSSGCPVAPCRPIRSIHGASASILWAVGDVGAVVQITNADTDEPESEQLNAATWSGLSGVWAASDTDVWAVGGAGTILHYAGTPPRWDVVADVPTNENLNAVWGTTPADVWAVGNAGVALHYDGRSWSRVGVAGLGPRRPDLTAVWCPQPGRVWIGGVGIVLALGGKP